MKLNTLSYAEATEQVASLLVSTDALVVDMRDAAGYPTLMVLVRDCMPLFVFVKPDWKIDDETWQHAKRVVTKNLADVNATWFDISDTDELDWMMGEILKRTKPGDLKDSLPPVQVTAEQQGFDSEASEPVVATQTPKVVRERRGGPITAVEKAKDPVRKWLE